MNLDLLNKDAFNDYAARFGWDYDNGGLHRGLHWDWYVSETHCWDKNPDGTSQQVVVIMRRETLVAAVHIRTGVDRAEIWSGEIHNSFDFDRLLEGVANYMAKHGARNPWSAAAFSREDRRRTVIWPLKSELRSFHGDISE